ncbi:pre-mRNA 3' end processing protein WDR33-like [Oscarella lobularis]|uniref:pre-mRNA 3' end processing protein WDR33-like n=1 Tax=Oscarella lobularis TaxID=121494 RepID=UPI00331414CA
MGRPTTTEPDQGAPPPINPATGEIDPSYDGKRVRKEVNRKTIDYNSYVLRHIESRVWQRGPQDRKAIQPDICYYGELLAPMIYADNPVNAVTTEFVCTSTKKFRCPIFEVDSGRLRLMTGASSGEFTLWNGLTFNFKTILQAHDSAVRTMTWSHNDLWLISQWILADEYEQCSHVARTQEAVREASVCPTDAKFTACSDDGTVRIIIIIIILFNIPVRWYRERGLVFCSGEEQQAGGGDAFTVAYSCFLNSSRRRQSR